MIFIVDFILNPPAGTEGNAIEADSVDEAAAEVALAYADAGELTETFVLNDAAASIRMRGSGRRVALVKVPETFRRAP